MLKSPYIGGTHLSDVTAITPLFEGDTPVMWLRSRGHHADIGRRTPGSAPPDSTHIDEEGVLIDKLAEGRLSYPMDHGATIEVAVTVDRIARVAVIDFTGTSREHSGNYNAPRSICDAAVLYVFPIMVVADIPLNQGCLNPLRVVVPESSMQNPVYPAPVISANTEVSQATGNALYGALGVIACSQRAMNNFVWDNDEFQKCGKIAGDTGAGLGFHGYAQIELAAGAVFGMETSGGGGWGKS